MQLKAAKNKILVRINKEKKCRNSPIKRETSNKKLKTLQFKLVHFFLLNILSVAL